jgi:Protein of unknown function (DUF1838)
MKKSFVIFVLFIVSVTCVKAQTDQFTPELFKQFTTMRVGTGEPVYWYCIGEIYSYPDGKLVAKVEGIDTARVIKSESNATKVLQLSRKIFFYRDAATNEVLKEVNGQKVEPIAYPYQQITYELRGGKMFANVVQGKQPRIQKIDSSGGNLVRKFGDVLVFSAPLFLNFPNYQAFENYDFFIQPKAKKGTPKYQLTWNRRGSLPPFFGGGDSVFQLVSYRVDKYADLPETMREVLESDGRLWINPPKDLKEIEELQK